MGMCKTYQPNNHREHKFSGAFYPSMSSSSPQKMDDTHIDGFYVPPVLDYLFDLLVGIYQQLLK
jgi:hypothetical protein